MADNAIQCFFCGQPAVELPRPGDRRQVRCAACGDYSLAGTAEQLLSNQPFDAAQLAQASGWLREHPDTLIDANRLEELHNLPRLNPMTKSTKLLRYLENRIATPGDPVLVSLDDRNVRASAWLATPDELEWQIVQSLTHGQGHIESERLPDGRTFRCVITPRGFEALRTARRPRLGFRDEQV